MITQIEIDGFKTFKDFKVELAPFQVIVGPNGSGKSNLFDALQLLSRLVETDVFSAFQDIRGEANEAFTRLPEGQTSKRIRIAVELLLDQSLEWRTINKLFSSYSGLLYTRLRYELEIALRADEFNLERPYITHESLKTIPRDKDIWCKKYGLFSHNGWIPEHKGIPDEATFIGTGYAYKSLDGSDIFDMETPIITVYREDLLKGNSLQFSAANLQRPILNTISSPDYTSIFATHEEIRSWRFLHLNPEVVRKSSSTKAPRFLSQDGENLPTTLARIQAEDKFAFGDISLDMANLVPGIVAIEIDEDKARNQYTIQARDGNQRTFSAQVLSDGTLRLLALATLRNDPQFRGVLCLEEPENGVHPLRLKNMAHLLRTMATDFKDQQQIGEPLRQVLITTHSPTFISQPEILDSLLFAYTVMHVEPASSGSPSLEITCMTPVVTSHTQNKSNTDMDKDETMAGYTIDQVIKYLDSENLDSARDQLNDARTSLFEG